MFGCDGCRFTVVFDRDSAAGPGTATPTPCLDLYEITPGKTGTHSSQNLRRELGIHLRASSETIALSRAIRCKVVDGRR